MLNEYPVQTARVKKNSKNVIKCEVSTGKYCLRFCNKNRRQYFPVQTEQTRLIRDLLYGFVGLQFVADSDWSQLRGLAILALRGALKFFAVLNVLGEDFMVFWREHNELFSRFPEEFKNSK